MYIPSGNKILKVSKTIPPEEIARRTRILAPNPDWHREQAAAAETSQQWFAVRFHLRKLSDLRPDDADAKRRLQAVEDQLKPREVAPPPRAAK